MEAKNRVERIYDSGDRVALPRLFGGNHFERDGVRMMDFHGTR